MDHDADRVLAEKERIAHMLAKKHYEVEPELIQIIRYSGNVKDEAIPTEPIKLLEVNKAALSSGIVPLHFGPVVGSGITFPSIIIEVTPAEYRQIQSKQLDLPKGWRRGQELSKPAED